MDQKVWMKSSKIESNINSYSIESYSWSLRLNNKWKPGTFWTLLPSPPLALSLSLAQSLILARSLILLLFMSPSSLSILILSPVDLCRITLLGVSGMGLNGEVRSRRLVVFSFWVLRLVGGDPWQLRPSLHLQWTMLLPFRFDDLTNFLWRFLWLDLEVRCWLLVDVEAT